MPSKGDFYKIVCSPMDKSVGEIVQLIEEVKYDGTLSMWLVRASRQLETIGGTKETLLWIPIHWMKPMETFKV